MGPDNGPDVRQGLQSLALLGSKGAHLSAEGHGKAAQWALCEMPTCTGKPKDLSFRTWSQKKNPRTNIVHLRHKNRASGGLEP